MKTKIKLFIAAVTLFALIAPINAIQSFTDYFSEKEITVKIPDSVKYTHEIREGEKKCACGENQIAEEEKPCTYNDCCLDYLVGSLYRLISELLDSIFDYYFWF